MAPPKNGARIQKRAGRFSKLVFCFFRNLNPAVALKQGICHRPIPLLVPMGVVFPIIFSDHLVCWLLVHENRKQADELGVTRPAKIHWAVFHSAKRKINSKLFLPRLGISFSNCGIVFLFFAAAPSLFVMASNRPCPSSFLDLPHDATAFPILEPVFRQRHEGLFFSSLPART